MRVEPVEKKKATTIEWWWFDVLDDPMSTVDDGTECFQDGTTVDLTVEVVTTCGQ